MGRDLFSEMIARYGAATLQRAFLRIWEQSERKARAAVSAIPDGTYGATASLDDDGISLGSPVPIDVKVVVSGDELTVDFSDLAPQMAGPFNSGRYGGGITAARMALKYLTTPHETANEGCFRPLKVILPDGTFLSAGKDAPMALFSAPIASVIDVIIRALEEPAPGLVTGGHHATFGIHLFHGKDPRTGELYQHFDAASGGYGASARQDGGGPYKTMIDGDTKGHPGRDSGGAVSAARRVRGLPRRFRRAGQVSRRARCRQGLPRDGADEIHGKLRSHADAGLGRLRRKGRRPGTRHRRATGSAGAGCVERG